MAETYVKMSDVIEILIKKERKRKQLAGILRLTFSTVLLCYLLFQILFGITIIKGTSMEPGIPENSVVVYSRLEKAYKANDVVIAEVDRQQVIKRIYSLDEKSVFLLSDNLENSIDSRTFGAVAMEQLKGKVIFTFHFFQ